MFGKTLEHIPESDKDALKTRGVMHRSRILAEVIAGRINPKDKDIPKWLQDARPQPPKVTKPRVGQEAFVEPFLLSQVLAIIGILLD